MLYQSGEQSVWLYFLCEKNEILQRLKCKSAGINNHGGRKMRTKITLACTECKQRNYNTTKEKKTMPDRMEIKKYCRFCKKHTLHKETK